MHVITRANNQESIEASTGNQATSNLVFHYYDLPRVLMFWKKGRRGYQLYYYFWQIFIYFKFKKFINTSNFDVVHHLTFGANWMPSLLMLTNPKTLWGPVGSEDVYAPVLKSLPFNIRLKEFLRRIAKDFFYYIEPARWLTIINADLILNHSSKFAKYKYPNFILHKVKPHIQTGINTSEPEYAQVTKIKEKDANSPIKLIITSELVAWKGVLLASEIFSIIANKRNDVELVVLGEGPEKQAMKNIFSKYAVEKKVYFKGFVSKKVLIKELYEADILLYPAYHHGLATLILQTMYCYLPIVSMEGDIISEVINNKCGLTASGKTMDEIKNNLLLNTIELIDNETLRRDFALKGRKMVEDTYEWSKLTLQMNLIYSQLLDSDKK